MFHSGSDGRLFTGCVFSGRLTASYRVGAGICRGRHGHAVIRSGLDIGADRDFHTDIPGVAFVGPVHSGIAGFIPVFGGAGRINNRGLDWGILWIPASPARADAD